MKWIKPYGESRVVSVNKQEKPIREIDFNETKLEIKKDPNQEPLTDAEKQKIYEEKLKKPLAISTLDKLGRRPRTGKPTQFQRKLRESIADNLLPEKIDYKGKDKNNVHPYDKGTKTDEKTDKKTVEQFSNTLERLCGKDNRIKNLIDQCKEKDSESLLNFLEANQEAIKEAIKIYIDQRLKNELAKIKRNVYPQENRLIRILCGRQENDIKIQTVIEQFEKQFDKARVDYGLENFCKTIKNTIDNIKKPKRVNYKVLLDAHRKHWRNLDETKQSNLLIDEYHQLVKRALKSRYSSKKKQENDNGYNSKGLNADELHNLVCNIAKNKMTNYLIKIGKIKHYENSLENKDLQENWLWSSEGQTHIKQMEALVQQWFIACSFSNRNLTKLIAPDGLKKINDDPIDLFVTDGKTAAESILKKEEEVKRIKDGLKLIYHDGKDPFIDKVILDEFLISYIRQYATEIRNNTVHFHNGSQLVNTILNNQSKDPSGELKKYIDQYIDNDIVLFEQKTKEQLKTIKCDQYLSEEQLRQVVPLLFNERHQENLPSFSRLIQRYNNAWKGNKDFSFINSEEKKNLNTDERLRCRYELLKWLYEKQDFSCFLENTQMETYCKEAKKRAGQAHGIPANMKSIRNIKNNESINDYMDFLQSETAKYFSLQDKKDAYHSDAQGAKDHASFIEKFRQDIVLQAFVAYLKCNKLDFLTQEQKSRSCDERTFEAILKEQSTKGKERLTQDLKTYHKLYMYVHLVPIDQLNMLLHQMIKSQVCLRKSKTDNERTDKEQTIESISAISKVLSFYSEMHDLKYSGKIEDFEKKQFGCFYEDGVLDELTGDDDKALLPLRSLREIQRFGNLPFIQRFIPGKITNEDWNAYCNDKNNMDKKNAMDGKTVEKILTDLHKKWVKGKEWDAKEDCQKYKKNLDIKVSYRQSRAKCLLQDHKSFYQIVTSLYSRLLGYEFKYERDMYCIHLACGGNKIEGNISLKNLKAAGRWLNFILNEEPFSQFNKTRNAMVHFNDFDRLQTQRNMLDIINNTRSMMSYDRKLKNSVSKSVIDFFQRYGFSVKFSIDNDHQLCLRTISCDTIKHLNKGKNKCKIDEKKLPIEEEKNSEFLKKTLEKAMGKS